MSIVSFKVFESQVAIRIVFDTSSHSSGVFEDWLALQAIRYNKLIAGNQYYFSVADAEKVAKWLEENGWKNESK